MTELPNPVSWKKEMFIYTTNLLNGTTSGIIFIQGALYQCCYCLLFHDYFCNLMSFILALFCWFLYIFYSTFKRSGNFPWEPGFLLVWISLYRSDICTVYVAAFEMTIRNPFLLYGGELKMCLCVVFAGVCARVYIMLESKHVVRTSLPILPLCHQFDVWDDTVICPLVFNGQRVKHRKRRRRDIVVSLWTIESFGFSWSPFFLSFLCYSLGRGVVVGGWD